ncbi:MAG: phage regulatory protein/antirepressor Ant [Herminiimonas sp.]|nr:phage regulatory protein/antirepressor Ant [Herminiimonas sp.]
MSRLMKEVTPTMTSREIAELTGKEHFHVVRDIELMLEQLELKERGYIQTWIHPQNKREYRGYSLPKNLTLTLVSGYNAKLRMRIIDRWLELESAVEDKRRLRHVAASSYKLMSEVLQLRREMDGKQSAPHHFMNEARLVNHALTGAFKGLNRDLLSARELDVLGQLEVKNSALIATGHDYQARKVKLTGFIESFKIAHPGILHLEVA